jgi:hypothetical protein
MAAIRRVDIHDPFYYSDLRSTLYTIEDAETGEKKLDERALIKDLRRLVVIRDGVPQT